jgi:hypothetical protein
MRSLLLFILLGLAALGLATGTPSLAQARPWRDGWYGGRHRGFYPRLWWGRPYAYPRWGPSLMPGLPTNVPLKRPLFRWPGSVSW